jgi:hypothetical protein
MLMVIGFVVLVLSVNAFAGAVGGFALLSFAACALVLLIALAVVLWRGLD